MRYAHSSECLKQNMSKTPAIYTRPSRSSKPSECRERSLAVSKEIVRPWLCNGDETNRKVLSRLIHGENLNALQRLECEGLLSGVDLIYVDPPFFVGQDFYTYSKTAERGDGHDEAVYSDRWAGGLDDYLDMLRQRLELLLKLLSPNGNLLLHLDWHAVHYAKVLLDELLGRNAFRNEIIWCYTGPGSPNMRQFNRKHDSILWYAKGDSWTFNSSAVRQPHHNKTQANFKKGLGGSGFGPEERNLPPGKVPEDWWNFAVAARFPVDGIRRTGYPTEKPVALLERLVLALSNPGDLVLDAFCGSGTLPYVAESLGRRWIGIDNSVFGIHLARKRLIASAKHIFAVERLDGDAAYQVQCGPVDTCFDFEVCSSFDAISYGELENGVFCSQAHLLQLGREKARRFSPDGFLSEGRCEQLEGSLQKITEESGGYIWSLALDERGVCSV